MLPPRRFTFLESPRRADVKLYILTCNAATYRFRDIRGQTAEILA